MEEERKCKTCVYFHSTAWFCRAIDDSVAEWDTCKGHKTYDEVVAEAKMAEFTTKSANYDSKDVKE